MKNLLAGKEIVEKKKIWFLIPLVVIVIALIAFGIFAGVNGSAKDGINIGIDFTGGTMVTVQVEDAQNNFKAETDKISSIINDNGGKVSYTQMGEGNSVIVRYGIVANDVQEKIKGALVAEYSDSVQITVIGATASQDLILTAIGAVALSTVLILIYIVLRFRNWFTGLAAVASLLHDVVMVLAFTIICNIQINSAFVAAVITIIAYSINNSIVLFDRVRDNKKQVACQELSRNDLVNRSVAETLMRSINTTVTTMAAIVVLAIIGVSSIKEFALPVLFGLLAGAYSSIFFAPSLYCTMSDLKDKLAERPKKPKKVKAPKAIGEAETK